MSYTDAEVFCLFEDLWEIYQKINPDKPSAGKKAFSVALKMGANHKDIFNATKVYALESQSDDPQYRYQLVNFINADHWKDIIEVHKDVEGYLRSLEKKQQDARNLIVEWNNACRSSACKVLDIETKVPLAIKALENEVFKKNWPLALKRLRSILIRTPAQHEPLSKIAITFRWFCKMGAKMTVMEIIEGQYGFPHEEPKLKDTPKERDLTEDEQQHIRNMLNETFADSMFGSLLAPHRTDTSEDEPRGSTDPGVAGAIGEIQQKIEDWL